MRRGIALWCVPAIAGSALMFAASTASADDAGIHELMLQGAAPPPAATQPETTAPAAATEAAPIVHRKHAVQARRDESRVRRTHMMQAQRKEISKEQMRHMHAHFHDMKNEKAPSSS